MKSKRKPHTLSRRERQIMDILYQLERATVGEVLSKLPDKPNYSTVRAQLRVLEEKGTFVMKKRACDTFTSPAFPARWRAARRCDISSKRSLRVPRRKPSRPCLAAKFHAFTRTSSIDLPPSSPAKKTKVHYESTEHLATSGLVPAELHRQDHLGFWGWRLREHTSYATSPPPGATTFGLWELPLR